MHCGRASLDKYPEVDIKVTFLMFLLLGRDKALMAHKPSMVSMRVLVKEPLASSTSGWGV